MSVLLKYRRQREPIPLVRLASPPQLVSPNSKHLYITLTHSLIPEKASYFLFRTFPQQTRLRHPTYTRAALVSFCFCFPHTRVYVPARVPPPPTWIEPTLSGSRHTRIHTQRTRVRLYFIHRWRKKKLYISVHFCIFVYISVYLCTFLYISVPICTFLYISVHFRTFRYLSVHFRTFLYIFVTLLYRFLQKCTEMYRYVLKCMKIYRIIQKCTKMYTSKK